MQLAKPPGLLQGQAIDEQLKQKAINRQDRSQQIALDSRESPLNKPRLSNSIARDAVPLKLL